MVLSSIPGLRAWSPVFLSLHFPLKCAQVRCLNFLSKLLPLHGCDAMRFGVTCLWFDLLVASCEAICGTTPVLRCTIKKHNVLLQNYSVLPSRTPHLISVLQSTALYYKHYASTSLHYPVLLCTTKYYSSTTTPVPLCTTAALLCTTKIYASTTLYYKVLHQYYSVLQFSSRRCSTAKLRAGRACIFLWLEGRCFWLFHFLVIALIFCQFKSRLLPCGVLEAAAFPFCELWSFILNVKLQLAVFVWVAKDPVTNFYTSAWILAENSFKAIAHED